MSSDIRYYFFFSSRRRHTRYIGDWSSDVCSSDLSRVPGRAKISHGEGSRRTRQAAGGRRGAGVDAGGRRRSEERRVGKECRWRGWGWEWKRRERSGMEKEVGAY